MALKLVSKNNKADLDVAREVLAHEAQALIALSKALNGEFSRAIDTLIGAKGRVIVTGVGKSGHVARKIAATMASTGTPSHYVHPNEASHGDLGMIMRGDAVLMLSNSGKVPELREVIYHCKRFDISLIAMTSNAASPLAEAADVVLLMPQQKEAGALGLAPTTSTTMQMALGDALAVALIERRGFKADDFKVLHPGGALGAQLMRVDEIMHKGKDIPLVKSGTRMDVAVKVLSEKSFGCVGVVDKAGKLLGIVTDGDIRRHIGSKIASMKVDAVMTKSPIVIEARHLAAEALALMTEKRKITQLFVVKAGKPVGLVHMHDLLRLGVK